ncbi:MAG: ribulose-phosphate 3-epimerase [Candidatus Woesearchaeota archaeon]|nr:ribulose-phosphate 3-epimerase [Candidatus Woesearchaeota archaeon]
MNYEIVPSLLSVEKDAQKYAAMVENYVKRMQFDVMDGIFVEEKAFSSDEVYHVNTKAKKEAHLMTIKPADDIPDYALAGADTIIFHIEAKGDPKETIRLIREAEAKVGIALNPKTPVKKIVPYLNDVDIVLVMTVEPGKGGQNMIEDCLKKVSEIRKIKKEIDIEVDGGINATNIKKAKDAGANLFVCGYSIFGEKDPVEAIKKLKEAAQIQ